MKKALAVLVLGLIGALLSPAAHAKEATTYTVRDVTVGKLSQDGTTVPVRVSFTCPVGAGGGKVLVSARIGNVRYVFQGKETTDAVVAPGESVVCTGHPQQVRLTMTPPLEGATFEPSTVEVQGIIEDPNSVTHAGDTLIGNVR